MVSQSAVKAALRLAAAELGAPPTSSWWQRSGRRPTYAQIVQAVGGGWAEALAVADLEPVDGGWAHRLAGRKLQRVSESTDNDRRFPSPEEAIGALRAAHVELGHSPTTTWWVSNERWPRYSDIRKVLGGGWSEALDAAGLPPTALAAAPAPHGWTRDEIISALREAAVELGRSPTSNWWQSAGRRPSYAEIVRRLGGGWAHALTAAGLPPTTYTARSPIEPAAERASVVDALRTASRKYLDGAAPTASWWKTQRLTPPPDAIVKAFGSWRLALSVAGLAGLPTPSPAAGFSAGRLRADGLRPIRRLPRRPVPRRVTLVPSHARFGGFGSAGPSIGDTSLRPRASARLDRSECTMAPIGISLDSRNREPVERLPIHAATADWLRAQGLWTVGDVRLAGLAGLVEPGEISASKVDDLLAALPELLSDSGLADLDASAVQALVAALRAPPGRYRPGRVRVNESHRAIVEMRFDGVPSRDIAARFGITRTRVDQVVEKVAGAAKLHAVLTQHHQAAVAAHEHAILALFRKGRDPPDIARELGVGFRLVRDVIDTAATPRDQALRRESRSQLREPRSRYWDGDLIAAIRQVAERIGDVPTIGQYQLHARRLELPSVATIISRLGSWSAAVSAAGMTPQRTPRREYKKRWSPDACWVVLARLTNELGHPPTAQQYDLLAGSSDDLPSLATVRKRLGRWSAVTARLLGPSTHPLLDRLGLDADTDPHARNEAIFLAFLADEIDDDEIGRLANAGFFQWLDTYGDPPASLVEEDT